MYLTERDYFPSITIKSLDEITDQDSSNRTAKEGAALTEVKSYLAQKYDIGREFRDTVKFSFTSDYNAKQLVFLDASAYDPSSTYALNALTLYQGNVYFCKTAITIAEAFTLSKWTLIGAQYAYWYIPIPYDEFEYKKIYSKNDLVWWKDKVYQALKDSSPVSHNEAIQYNRNSSIPYANQFPDASGQTQWAGISYRFNGLMPTAVNPSAYSALTSYTTGDRVLYNSIVYQAFASSTGATPGTNLKWLPVSWTSGDNRNAQIVQSIILMVIYRLSSRISPRNVPDVWVKNYDDTVNWLKRCAKGEITLDFPLKQPNQGRIWFDSAPRNINSY